MRALNTNLSVGIVFNIIGTSALMAVNFMEPHSRDEADVLKAVNGFAYGINIVGLLISCFGMANLKHATALDDSHKLSMLINENGLGVSFAIQTQ